MPAPLANPVYLPPKRCTALSGFATPTTAKVAVFTLIDPASTPVTLTCNGVNYSTASGTLVLTARGSPTVCWTGVVTSINLKSGTTYPWTVTQGTWTDSGSLMSEPQANHDFDNYFWSCDRNTTNLNLFNANPEKVPSWWQHQKRLMQTGGRKTFATIFVDDFGYVDQCIIRDNGSSYSYPNQSGLLSTGAPQTTLVLNDYLIAWCAMLGMVGPEQTVYDPDDLINSSISQYILSALWGREENRHYCLRNSNIYPQFGDHEMSNNLGFNVKLVDDYPNALFASAGVAGVGKVAWDAFWGLLQPPLGSGRSNTVANHWVCSVGPLTLAAPDRASSAIGNLATSYSPPTALTAILGTTQIADLLNEIQGFAKPFTLLCMSVGTRYLGAGPNYDAQYGDQHPLFNHVLAEFQALYTKTGASPKSLMDHPQTNGTLGCSVVLHGDTHHAEVVKLQAGAYTGNAAENIFVVTMGGTNASATAIPASPEVTSEGQILADCSIEFDAKFHPSMSSLGYSSDLDLAFHGVRIAVTGSSNPKSMVIQMRNFEDTVMWERKWVEYYNNGGMAVDTPIAPIPKVSQARLGIRL